MSDPVLTSSWCTAWGSYNTPRLWAMVKDEDDPEAWRQVAAWGEISTTVKDQRSALVNARDALVAAWPPGQNKSSEAFVAELNILIARLDSAKADADDTATGLANILEALRQAKNNIQPLWEQYKEKSDDLVPAWWDSAEDELDKKAQAHMITAEQIVQENVARLKVPDSYTLEPRDPQWEPMADDDGSSDTSGSDGSVSTRSTSDVTVPVPHDPVPPLPDHDPIVPDGGSGPDSGGNGSTGGSGVAPSGPGLAGVINPPSVSPPSALPPGGGTGVIPPGGGGSGMVPGPSPIIGPGIGGGSGTLRPGGGTGTIRGGGAGISGLGGGGVGGGGAGRGVRPVTGPRAMPSGAVIGESVAGAGRGGVGGAGVGGAGGRGAAARGGVAGRGTGQARPPRPSWLPDEPVGAKRAGAAGSPGVPGGARGGRRSASGEQPPFDPDNPWEVAEGVAPVITPAPDNARHDPGPNVIGWRG